MDIVLYFALGCAMLQGLLNVGIKAFNKERDDSSELCATIFYILSAIFIGGFSLVTGKLSFPELESLRPYVVNLILMVVLNGVGIMCVFKSLKEMEASSFTIFYSSNVIFTLFVSFVFLGEVLSGFQYVGLAIIFLGILILCYKKGELINNLKNAWPVWIASFCMGAVIVNTRYLLSDISPLNPYSYSVISFFATALFIFLTDIKKIGSGFKNFVNISFTKWMFGLGFIHALMLIFLYKALSFTEFNSVQVAGVMASSVFFGVVLATFLLGERKDAIKKILATIITFIGLWLIK